jgi:hypothetical protein
MCLGVRLSMRAAVNDAGLAVQFVVLRFGRVRKCGAVFVGWYNDF